MADPFRVGYLSDGPIVPSGPALDPMNLRFEEAVANGELDRPVEVVPRAGSGLPNGTAKGVCDAWLELADAGALVIIGPAITDNALAVRRLAEERRVPTINFSGCERTRGEFNFHWQLGSLPDEGVLLARAARQAGFTHVAVIRDRSPIGEEYWSYFSEAAEDAGLAIASDQKVSPVQTDLTAEVAAARSHEPDGLVYLGFGQVLIPLWQALDAAGWKPPAFTNTAGLHWYGAPPEAKALSAGWVYVDMYDEANSVTAGVLDRFEARYGHRPVGPLVSCQYDLATLAVQGLRKATVHTPEGVKEGLERVHQLPAATGGPGTVQGFGPWERTALKGADFLVLRVMGAEATTRYAG
ncbi:MAG: ABC transporter substrate-binding protein [Acidimicrobiia bacterium]